MYPVLALLIIVLCGGCTTHHSDFFPYADNGTKKPSLTLVPMYDGLEGSSGEEFSNQISHSIYNQIRSTGKLFIPPQEKMYKVLATFPEKNLFANTQLKAFKRFAPTDYVCAMELKEYRILPYKRGAFKPLYLANLPDEVARVLAIEIKLKIVDIRGEAPRIVRQEIVRSNHMISKDAFEDPSCLTHSSSLEQVQSRLARDLTEKIEETLCLTK